MFRFHNNSDWPAAFETKTQRQRTVVIYGMTHCYSEKNKGDAGIIIATLDAIRVVDPKAVIHLFSTYGVDNDHYKNDHNLIKTFADSLNPAFFPEPSLHFGGKQLDGVAAKLVAFFIHLVRMLVFLIAPRSRVFQKALLTKEEQLGFERYMASDLIVSKGGSYLYAFGDWRGLFGFFRMLYPFYLARRTGKRVAILGQSLGPVKGRIAKALFSWAINGVDHICLREKRTLALLKANGLSVPEERVTYVPDLAFSLRSEPCASLDKLIAVDGDRFGMTVVDFQFADPEGKNKYLDGLAAVMRQCLSMSGAKIFIFPQVTCYEPNKAHDYEMARDLLKRLSSQEKERVTFLEGEFSPMGLKNAYRQMTAFIATRLHSAIFALGANVPTLTISYHGTKATGTMALLGLDRYVVEILNVESSDLVARFVELYARRVELREQIADRVETLKSEIYRCVTQLHQAAMPATLQK